MTRGTRSLVAVAVLCAFCVSAWAADVSAVQGEATYKESPKFDVTKQTVAFGGVEYKWTDLINLKLRTPQEQPKSGYKIFFRNGNILYADSMTAGLKGVTILLNAKSAFLGPDAVVLNTDNISGVQSLNPKIYRDIALIRLRKQANAATFRTIDIFGKPMNADDLQKLYESDPDKFTPEGAKVFLDKSGQFEASMVDRNKWQYDFYYGTDISEAYGTIQEIKQNLDVTLETAKSNKKLSGNLYDLVGVGFKKVNEAKGFGEKPYVRVIGVRGDVITGEIVSEKDGMLELKADIGDVNVKVAEAEISEMVFYNGSFTFLSDLPDKTIKAVEYPEFCSPGTTTSDFPWQRDRSTLENHPPLKLNGKIYHKGIGVHSFSDLTFNVAGAYKAFKATVGIDDGVMKPGQPGGNITIEIQGDDGKVLLKKTVVKTGDKPLAVDVDITGVNNLRIIVDFGEDGYQNDHCDIANAILVK
jgi:hypothetical protein